jgi:hypothetical protein
VEAAVMAKKKKQKEPTDNAGFVAAGTDDAKATFAENYSFDLLFSMIAERIRDGEDPEAATKAVLDLVKDFASADDIIFDDDKSVTIEEEEKKDAD